LVRWLTFCYVFEDFQAATSSPDPLRSLPSLAPASAELSGQDPGDSEGRAGEGRRLCCVSEGMSAVGLTGLLYKEMVLSVWGPVVAALSVVLDCVHASPSAPQTAGEEEVDVARVLYGVGLCGQIAATVKAEEVLEALCFDLHRRAQLGLGQTDITMRGAPEGGAATRARSQSAVAGFGRSAKRQASFSSLLKLCTAHGQLLKGAWACVLESLLTLFCANLLALPSYSTAAPYAGSRSGTSASINGGTSASISGSVPGQQARASEQLASGRAPNGGGKAGKGWFSPLALWGGSSEEKDDVDVEAIAAARASVGRMLPDIGLFFSEVALSCLFARASSLLPLCSCSLSLASLLVLPLSCLFARAPCLLPLCACSLLPRQTLTWCDGMHELGTRARFFIIYQVYLFTFGYASNAQCNCNT
jgi:hypothetical protein